MTRTRRTGLGLLAAALVLAVGGCGSSDSAGDASSEASHNAADVAFASEMVPHHEQALQMVAMSEGRELSPDFEQLTQDIQDAQQPEIDEMLGWLESWGEPTDTASGHQHTPGMDMSGMGSDAPGMMGDDELGELTNTSDRSAFEQMWLTMMIAHHEGAIEMSKTELADGEFQPALDLADSIVASQTAEIALMKQLLQG